MSNIIEKFGVTNKKLIVIIRTPQGNNCPIYDMYIKNYKKLTQWHKVYR